MKLNFTSDANGNLTSYVSYGVHDEKGREVGHRYRITGYDAVKECEARCSYSSETPEQWQQRTGWPLKGFEVNASITRKGIIFGASHRSHAFATLEEAFAFAEAKAAENQKKQVKRFGKK